MSLRAAVRWVGKRLPTSRRAIARSVRRKTMNDASVDRLTPSQTSVRSEPMMRKRVPGQAARPTQKGWGLTKEKGPRSPRDKTVQKSGEETMRRDKAKEIRSSRTAARIVKRKDAASRAARGEAYLKEARAERAIQQRAAEAAEARTGRTPVGPGASSPKGKVERSPRRKTADKKK